MLNQILDNLQEYPATEPQPLNLAKREAAVLIALTDEVDSHLILTQRAAHLKAHASEVALPGGMWDRTDTSLQHTAVREGHEEVDLHPEQVEIVGTMPVCITRYGVRVTPFVGVIPPQVNLKPELSELDSIFRVPVRFLADKANLGRDCFAFKGAEYWLPCYHFEGFQIWGFTLGVLAEFLNHTLGAGIELDYSPFKDRVPSLGLKSNL